MPLDKDIYRKLEEIVGKDNVSDDIGVCETYRCIAAQSSAHYGPFEQITPLPQAVVLPGNTAEVQNVVKLCNKYGIKFKASTTFWSTMGYIGSDYGIQIDMKRMAKIEIDPKNMIAVFEPYAIGCSVQAEAMKYGLTPGIPGVGCSSSLVANFTGWGGIGPCSISMGSGSENILGVEWVFPDGEVVTMGSAGSGLNWFCGEGPGPSPRSVIRGQNGAAGSMGICTKMALRLHPWPGPETLPSEGTVPAYKAVLPDNFKCYTLCFPDWKKFAEAIVLCHENDVLYLGHRQFNLFGRDVKGAMISILTDPKKQLCDIPELMQDEKIRKETESMKYEFQVVIAGMAKGDMEYKEAAVDEILRRCDGWKNEMMLRPDIANWALLYMIRLGHKNLNFVYCGSFEGNVGLSPNIHISARLLEDAAMLRKSWDEKAPYTAATGGDSAMGSLSGLGGGGTVGYEYFVHFDAYDKASIRGAKEYMDASQEWTTKNGLGVDMGRWNVDLRTEEGYDVSQQEHNKMYAKMNQPLVAVYQWKVRETFNPNNLTGSYYRTLDPAYLETI